MPYAHHMVDAAQTAPQASIRKRVVAWGLWDWGSAAFNAVVLTFVFSVYLVDAVGDDLPGSTPASTWLGWFLAGAAAIAAISAPVTGRRSDELGRRKRSLMMLTVAVVILVAALFFVRDDYRYLWLGLALLAVGSVTFELSQVPYFAMLQQVSTPATVGRVSGFGFAMGYVGGIVLLLICYLGFIVGDGDTRGLLGIPTQDGLNIRLIALLCAVWFLLSAIPLFLLMPENQPLVARSAPKPSILDLYRGLASDVRTLWRRDRNTVWFLLASAVFRDGLAGVFTFGAVLAVTVYGVGAGDVLLFGIAANVIAATGALIGGRLDDVIGPKPVIVGSLAAMVAIGLTLFFVSGPTMFWALGLALCFFPGAVQSCARSYLARMTPEGVEGQMFGLYATTGRAVTFLSPLAFSTFQVVFGSEKAGVLGLTAVLFIGLLVILPVRAPAPAGR